MIAMKMTKGMSPKKKADMADMSILDELLGACEKKSVDKFRPKEMMIEVSKGDAEDPEDHMAEGDSEEMELDPAQIAALIAAYKRRQA